MLNHSSLLLRFGLLALSPHPPPLNPTLRPTVHEFYIEQSNMQRLYCILTYTIPCTLTDKGYTDKPGTFWGIGLLTLYSIFILLYQFFCSTNY